MTVYGLANTPLIVKGQAVLGLGYASAMDRERGARQIPRLRTCHSDVTKRHREGDWQLRSIFSARLSLIQGQSGEVAFISESHSHLSLTVSSRLFLLQVVNFPVLHRLTAALME